MADLKNIDKNLYHGSVIKRDDIVFYNIEEKEKFNVFGIFRENDRYYRLPQAVADTANDGVKHLCFHTAGGRVCFKTNSSFLAVSAKYNEICKFNMFPMSGAAGFDIYVIENGEQKYKSFIAPSHAVEDFFECSVDFEDSREREIVLNLPLYSGINSLCIGLKKDATITPINPYTCDKKVVFYGSSITQGASASRPGNCYTAILSRRFKFDYVNLGFAGSAIAEDTIAEYISNLDMDVFVYDYDHNANTAEYLEKTHEKMFKKFRSKHPETPVIFMTRPNHILPYKENYKVVLKTYENAKAAGDNNVYFVSGQEMLEYYDAEVALVDGIHPTDVGFLGMAECVGKVLKEIL